MKEFIRVIDFETTDASAEAEPIELGWTDLYMDGEISGPYSMMITPTRKISPDAMAVHHISDAQASGGVSDKSWIDLIFRVRHGERLAGIMAHSIDTEKTMLDLAKTPENAEAIDSVPWICTFRCALYAHPEAAKHSNQFLRYWLDGGLPLADQNLGLPAHRAGPDSYVTAYIGQNLLQKMSLDQAIEISTRPPLRPYLWFGKHKGKTWQEVDIGFYDWMRRQDFDKATLYHVEEELKRRRGEPSAFDALLPKLAAIAEIRAESARLQAESMESAARSQIQKTEVKIEELPDWDSAPLTSVALPENSNDSAAGHPELLAASQAVESGPAQFAQSDRLARNKNPILPKAVHVREFAEPIPAAEIYSGFQPARPSPHVGFRKRFFAHGTTKTGNSVGPASTAEEEEEVVETAFPGT